MKGEKEKIQQICTSPLVSRYLDEFSAEPVPGKDLLLEEGTHQEGRGQPETQPVAAAFGFLSSIHITIRMFCIGKKML